MKHYYAIEIPKTSAVSSELDLSELRDAYSKDARLAVATPAVVAVVLPETLDTGTASLVVEANYDGVYRPVLDASGNLLEISVSNANNGTVYLEPPTALLGAQGVRVRTVDTLGADVTQSGPRTLGLVVASV